MSHIEIAYGEVIIGLPNCRKVASLSPIPDGFWVGIGYPNEQGILVSNDEWAAFVELVQSVDRYIKENHNA